MRNKRMKCGVIVSLMAAGLVAAVFPATGWAQDEPGSDNMQILRDKLKADKKLLVAANMELTESEAKGFWPVYDAYQKDLAALNQHLPAVVALGKYADLYKTRPVRLGYGLTGNI